MYQFPGKTLTMDVYSWLSIYDIQKIEINEDHEIKEAFNQDKKTKAGVANYCAFRTKTKHIWHNEYFVGYLLLVHSRLTSFLQTAYPSFEQIYSEVIPRFFPRLFDIQVGFRMALAILV
jgi:hypothetical protein